MCSQIFRRQNFQLSNCSLHLDHTLQQEERYWTPRQRLYHTIPQESNGNKTNPVADALSRNAPVTAVLQNQTFRLTSFKQSNAMMRSGLR